MLLVIVTLGLLWGLAWIFWYLFHVQITWLIQHVRIGEMWLVSLLEGKDYVVNVPDAGTQRLSAWRSWLSTAKVDEIGLPEIQVSTYIAVLPLRYIFAALLGAMSLGAYFYGPGTQYRRRMDLETLIREQSRAFPAIAPFIKFNPHKLASRVLGGPVPEKLPLFAEALSPEEWVAYHKIKVHDGRLDYNQAWQALAPQLGERWQGPLKLPEHAQGLYAAFALRHIRRRKESEDLLNQMSLAWTPGGRLNLPTKVKAQIRAVIKDPKIGGVLQPYTDQHAFVTTALLRALARAREGGGVLAPASFLWLRGHDRALWYPLNNLGRRSYHAEAVGALVHYTNELIAGQKIPTPRFEEVIKGMETFLRGPMARPVPPVEKSK